ncbi:fork head domain-domain-containing protein [Absidia repens]|uniref:Fork head domain-domain-containing protein n=1 Tax=Absidia repens TaxID=90262 RepID=A0A1X2IHL8_9FUNG|nr:fork head domain-domain-containing protein [Absidia repens]
MTTASTKTMSSSAIKNSTMEVSAMEKEAPTGPVQAYAKLEGESFCYYIRTLQVTLGRKVNRRDQADKVDIPLGNTKLVSRQHARLFYNFTTQRFEMMVIGKNGAFVNGQFVERGITVALENRTKIAIGESHFVFLLPYMDTGHSNNITQNDSSNCLSTTQHSEKQRKRKAQQQDSFNSKSTSSSSSVTININNHVDYTEEENVDEELKKTLIGYPGVPNPYLGKEDKPPFSYANLIAQALNNASTDKRMTLNEIYTYLSTAYPYFKKVSSTGWQNSVRHNLSLNKAFIKIPRTNNDSGKGAFWTIDPKLEYSIFATNAPIKQRSNKRSCGSSSPTSSNKDNDKDTTRTNTATTGSLNKKQRKDKVTKNVDSSRKGKVEPATKDSAPPSTSDTTEEPSSSMSTKKSAATSPSIVSNTTLEFTVQSEISEAEATTQEDKSIKSKQCIQSKSKANVSSSDSLSTSDIPKTLATPSSTVTLQTVSDASGSESTTPTDTAANVQAQLQLQLQNTIRQHLLDPIQYPLPPTIAQLLPQAIAQLPPQIANQLSSTLNVALRAQQQHHLQQQKQQQNCSGSEGSDSHSTQAAAPPSKSESNITSTSADTTSITEPSH